MRISFVKLANKWFYWNPSFIGEIEELQMVDGADNLLDKLSNGSNNIELNIKVYNYTSEVSGDFLVKVEETSLGSTYLSYIDNKYFNTLWLCNIILEVIGKFPQVIKFEKV